MRLNHVDASCDTEACSVASSQALLLHEFFFVVLCSSAMQMSDS